MQPENRHLIIRSALRCQSEDIKNAERTHFFTITGNLPTHFKQNACSWRLFHIPMNHMTKEFSLFSGVMIMATIDYFNRTLSCCSFIHGGQPTGIRLDKVQDTRRILRSGKYNFAERLSIGLDRLLEDLLEQNP